MSQVLRLPINNVPAGGDYTAAINLGSAGTQVQVLLDTGSSTLGVTVKNYQPNSDTSLTTTTLAQDVIYGTGAWAGPVVQSKVGLGEGGAAVSVDASVALITDDYEGFGQADGIMGLAYGALNNAYNMASYLESHGGKTASYPWPFSVRNSSTAIRRLLKLLQKMPVDDVAPYFDALESAGVVANLFAFYTLRSFPSFATGNPATDPVNGGWFILGGGPEQNDLYKGQFQDVDVVDDDYYNVDLLAVQVGDGTETPVAPLSPADESMGSNAIVDSGTNSLVVTAAAYETLINALTKLNPAFGQAIKSATSSQTIDQTQVTLDEWPTISFILRDPTGNPVKLSCAPSTYWQFDTGAKGQASFQIQNGGMPLSILGLPLFNNYYMVFDRSADSSGVIHFATINPSATTSALTP